MLYYNKIFVCIAAIGLIATAVSVGYFIAIGVKEGVIGLKSSVGDISGHEIAVGRCICNKYDNNNNQLSCFTIYLLLSYLLHI